MLCSSKIHAAVEKLQSFELSTQAAAVEKHSCSKMNPQVATVLMKFSDFSIHFQSLFFHCSAWILSFKIKLCHRKLKERRKIACREMRESKKERGQAGEEWEIVFKSPRESVLYKWVNCKNIGKLRRKHCLWNLSLLKKLFN